MSTPAALPKTGGGNFTMVPNRFLDSLHRFTPAETALALLVLRRNGYAPISDSNWQAWTGYSERHKQNAIKGLERQEFFEVVGHGNSARYRPTLDRWSRHMSNHPPTPGKPRTAGRGPSVKTPVAGAHPCCVENGCQLTKRDEMSGQSTSVSAAAENIVSPLLLIKSPVRGSVSADAEGAIIHPVKNDNSPSTPLLATDNRKPVSNSARESEKPTSLSASDVGAPKLQQTAADSVPTAEKNVRSGKGLKSLTTAVATENWKPVSNSTAMGLNPRDGVVVPKPHSRHRKLSHPVPAPLNHEATLKFWPLSWAVVLRCFGMRPEFLVKFIPLWQKACIDLTDQMLADTLELGHKRRPDMKDVGLWANLFIEDLPVIRRRARDELDKARVNKVHVTTMFLKDLRSDYVKAGKPELACQLDPVIRSGPLTPEILEQLAKIDGGEVLRRLKEEQLI